ncbi:MAG: hypothetical protein U9N59_06030 [Campylobacterota bacterium]|nr:hypothetical protein [Campylobacterota bacterium]
MNWKFIFLPLLLLGLTGCVSDTKELNVVKSYKSVNNYKTITISKAENSNFLNQELQDKFEDILFEKLYTEKDSNNFVPGEELRLTYEVVNIQEMKKSFTDWGTYFGKDNSTFEILFTVYDANGVEVGLYHIDIDVEFWIYSTDSMALNNAFDTASYTVSQHLKANYLF